MNVTSNSYNNTQILNKTTVEGANYYSIFFDNTKTITNNIQNIPPNVVATPLKPFIFNDNSSLTIKVTKILYQPYMQKTIEITNHEGEKQKVWEETIEINEENESIEIESEIQFGDENTERTENSYEQKNEFEINLEVKVPLDVSLYGYLGPFAFAAALAGGFIHFSGNNIETFPFVFSLEKFHMYRQNTEEPFQIYVFISDSSLAITEKISVTSSNLTSYLNNITNKIGLYLKYNQNTMRSDQMQYSILKTGVFEDIPIQSAPLHPNSLDDFYPGNAFPIQIKWINEGGKIGLEYMYFIKSSTTSQHIVSVFEKFDFSWLNIICTNVRQEDIYTPFSSVAVPFTFNLQKAYISSPTDNVHPYALSIYGEEKTFGVLPIQQLNNKSDTNYVYSQSYGSTYQPSSTFSWTASLRNAQLTGFSGALELGILFVKQRPTEGVTDSGETLLQNVISKNGGGIGISIVFPQASLGQTVGSMKVYNNNILNVTDINIPSSNLPTSINQRFGFYIRNSVSNFTAIKEVFFITPQGNITKIFKYSFAPSSSDEVYFSTIFKGPKTNNAMGWVLVDDWSSIAFDVKTSFTLPVYTQQQNALAVENIDPIILNNIKGIKFDYSIVLQSSDKAYVDFNLSQIMDNTKRLSIYNYYISNDGPLKFFGLKLINAVFHDPNNVILTEGMGVQLEFQMPTSSNLTLVGSYIPSGFLLLGSTTSSVHGTLGFDGINAMDFIFKINDFTQPYDNLNFQFNIKNNQGSLTGADMWGTFTFIYSEYI